MGRALVAIDHRQLPMLVRTTPLIGVACLILWMLEGPTLWAGGWNAIGLPALAVVMFMATAVMLQQPAWATGAALFALAAGGVYLQGVLYLNLFRPQPERLYALLSTSQFMPLFYLMAFAGLKQGASLLSWLQSGAIAAQLFISMLHAHPDEPLILRQAKWALLLAQPLFIMALTFMARLRKLLAQQERDSYRSKERLLAMMSHEIRSPLQAMLSSVDLLAAKVDDGSSQRAVQRLELAATQLDRHLRDLLEFARLDNPDLSMEKRPYDLQAVVQSVCDGHREQAWRKHLDLVMHASPHAFRLMGDAGRVRQILDNLVGNAVKYTVEGAVTVSVGPGPRPGWAQVDVADTGIGIASDQLPHVFEPFRRAAGTPRGQEDGSGLGLAIAQRLVERLGGRIEAMSTPGLGSRFRLLLPMSVPLD